MQYPARKRIGTTSMKTVPMKNRQMYPLLNHRPRARDFLWSGGAGGGGGVGGCTSAHTAGNSPQADTIRTTPSSRRAGVKAEFPLKPRTSRAISSMVRLGGSSGDRGV